MASGYRVRKRFRDLKSFYRSCRESIDTHGARSVSALQALLAKAEERSWDLFVLREVKGTIAFLLEEARIYSEFTRPSRVRAAASFIARAARLRNRSKRAAC